jgi:hypothetical protein
VAINVTVDMSGVSAKLDRIATDRGLGMFLSTEAASGMDQYVPYRDGALSGSATPEPFAVTYGVPYAAKLYYGTDLNISRQGHPNATALWDKAYKAAKGGDLGMAGTQYVRGM